MQRGEWGWVTAARLSPPLPRFFSRAPSSCPVPLFPRCRRSPALRVLLRCPPPCRFPLFRASSASSSLSHLNFPHPPARPRLAFSLLPFSLPPPLLQSVHRTRGEKATANANETDQHAPSPVFSSGSLPSPFPFPLGLWCHVGDESATARIHRTDKWTCPCGLALGPFGQGSRHVSAAACETSSIPQDGTQQEVAFLFLLTIKSIPKVANRGRIPIFTGTAHVHTQSISEQKTHT